MKVSRDAELAISLALTVRTVAPTIRHLFGGFDVTIFAYGSTGSGKTHTMRGGKSLAERGIIPRLLSGSEYQSRCSRSLFKIWMRSADLRDLCQSIGGLEKLPRNLSRKSASRYLFLIAKSIMIDYMTSSNPPRNAHWQDCPYGTTAKKRLLWA